MAAHYDTVILGAGAAGLLCAMTAASRGRRVVVIDRSNRIGKKILMSGGGKCNFTNLHVTPDRFLSRNPHFCKSALARYTQWDFIDLVERHGIEYFEKQTVNGLSGQLFCRESSKQIVAMLRQECESQGVDILTDCETERVVHRDGFRLETTRGVFHGDTLVVATGALSIPSLGGSGFGYTLAEQFGLTLTPRRAGLVPFTFSDEHKAVFSRLSGVSTEVNLSNERASFREEMLFTHRGLSGPAVLQLSSYWEPGEEISVDLSPSGALEPVLAAAKAASPRSNVRKALGGLLPRKLLQELEDLLWPEDSERFLGEWSDQALKAVGRTLNHWDLTPSGTEGYRKAEVTLGGVDTRHLSSRTMECSTAPGLFFIGEVVDVTGHLGGFNFQWAWSSGHAAGMAV
ncbi:MAG: NAD(P)/FAD-dependent oxidoreductase [Xanthomonadales bacterium]|jgi:predicted Rossmann fold flavoprotein|nr:NAD(P)/FAD-dependent oxidoreductase [Xanthomonadales bacterium]